MRIVPHSTLLAGGGRTKPATKRSTYLVLKRLRTFLGLGIVKHVSDFRLYCSADILENVYREKPAQKRTAELAAQPGYFK